MNVKVQRIVEGFKDKITIIQTLYEAIANSLEANASNVKITLNSFSAVVEPLVYDTFSITDNGDGFNNDNLKSFLEYLSSYKKLQYGCKGVGRFTWLKVFSSVKIHSVTNKDIVDIVFDLDFDENDIKHLSKSENNEGLDNETTISFLGCKLSQTDYVELSLNEIRELIINNFAIKLFFINKEGRSFDIEITDDKGSGTYHITNDDLLVLSEKQFGISNSYCSKQFKMYYSFYKNSKNKRDIVLCADKRGIENINKSGKVLSSLPNNDSITCLIISDYLNETVNDSRSGFSFKGSDDSMFDLSRKEIEEAIKREVETVVVEEYPSIKEKNQEVINKCIEEYPYLKPYIDQQNSIILEPDKVIASAEAIYDKKKKKVAEEVNGMINSSIVDEEKLIEGIMNLNDFSNRELAKYFLYRQKVIDCLAYYINKHEPVEKLLHNLFITQGEKLSNSLEDRLKNNIWLLDDKFMSYTNAYSDVKVETIKKLIKQADIDEGEDTAVEPDLTIFYSNKTAVVVEFKALGANYNKKIDAIAEINRNIGIVSNNINGINSIYGFIITQFDEVFLKRIEWQPGVKRMFDNNGENMFYLYNEKIHNSGNQPIPCHIYILSAETIYSDANARNKLFIDIIKQEKK